jgi:hypothetical protein
MLCVVERARRTTLEFAFWLLQSPAVAQIGADVIPTFRRDVCERFSQRVSE